MVSEILNNTDKIISAIKEQANISDEEIHERIKKKQEQYGGLLNEGGAAYSIAKDLNVTTGFEPKPAQIKELSLGTNNVRIVVQVQQAFPLNEFERAGRKGCVQNLVVKDATGECRIVLWNRKELVNEIKQNATLTVENAYTKDNNGNLEVHVGNYGKITVSDTPQPALQPQTVPQPQAVPAPALKPAEQTMIKTPPSSSLKNLKENESVSFDGKITEILPAYEFSRSAGGKGRLRSATVTDGTAETRLVFWNDKVDLLNSLREGQEIAVKNAKVRNNKGQLELHYAKGTEVTGK